MCQFSTRGLTGAVLFVQLAVPSAIAQEISFKNTAHPTLDVLGDPLPPQASMRLGTERFLHPSPVTFMALSPDANTVVTFNSRFLIAWDSKTGAERWRQDWRAVGEHILGVGYGQNFVSFSDDGSNLYTVGAANEIHVWQTLDGKRETIKVQVNWLAGLLGGGRLGGFTSIDAHSDGAHFLVGDDKALKLVDDKGKTIWSVTNSPTEDLGINGNGDRLSMTGHYASGLFSPGEELIASVLSEAPREIRLLDPASGEERGRIALNDKLVRMAFHPTEPWLYTTERDCATRCYSLKSRERQWEDVLPLDPQGAESYTSTIATSPDGKWVATAAPIGPSHLIYLLDAESGQRVRVLDGHAWKPWGVAFTNDSRTLYSTGWDAAIRRWDVATGDQLSLPQGIRGTDVVTISQDGERVAFVDDSQVVRILDAASGEQLQQVAAPERHASLIAFDNDGKTLLAAGQLADTGDQREVGIWEWQLDSGKLLNTWDWPRGGDSHADIEALDISSDGRTIVAASFRQHRCVLWDRSSGKRIGDLPHRQVYGMDISPDGKWVATVGWDRALRVWDLGKREAIADVSMADAFAEDVRERDLRMYGVRYAPHGRRLAIAHMDGTTSVWDVSEPQHPSRTHTVQDSSFVFGAIDFSPDGMWIATGSSSGKVQVFDALSGQTAFQLGDHSQHVVTVKFGADSRTLVSGGGGLGYVWSLVPRSITTGDTTVEDFDAAWAALASDEAQAGYVAVWRLAEDAAVAERLYQRILRVETVLDLDTITRDFEGEVAARRKQLARKASASDPSIELLTTVHRALLALRLSRAKDSTELIEQLYQQHNSERVRGLIQEVY